MDKHVLKAILRRWSSGQSISKIHQEEGFDRKTIRGYITVFQAKGYRPGMQLGEREQTEEDLLDVLPKNDRGREKRGLLEPYREELERLVNPQGASCGTLQPSEPVKPKTAYLILKEKYGFAVSYETFKLYAREIGLSARHENAPIRIETPAGQETQIDYGLVGTLLDAHSGKQRRVYAFAAKLSYSRLPYIQFTYSQNQESFVHSNIAMAEFYGGVTECLLIDNLKSGVLKADIWDPQINRAYAEFAEYYSTFIDTARVRTPTDKAKIERLIPQARELFRRIKQVHPLWDLRQINQGAVSWCREEYGRARHGTTGIAPITLFEEQERALLKSLPAQRFETPHYKPVKVHADRFLSFENKRYAMPEDCRGKSFIARSDGRMLQIFDSTYRLMRCYPITDQRVSWLPGDFPESQEALMQGSYPRYLVSRAGALGPHAERLVSEILKPHAWRNARMALGMLTVLERYRDERFFAHLCSRAAAKRVFNPKQVAAMFETERKKHALSFIPPLSQAGQAMIRDISEYLN